MKPRIKLANPIDTAIAMQCNLTHGEQIALADCSLERVLRSALKVARYVTLRLSVRPDIAEVANDVELDLSQDDELILRLATKLWNASRNALYESALLGDE